MDAFGWAIVSFGAAGTVLAVYDVAASLAWVLRRPTPLQAHRLLRLCQTLAASRGWENECPIRAAFPDVEKLARRLGLIRVSTVYPDTLTLTEKGWELTVDARPESGVS